MKTFFYFFVFILSIGMASAFVCPINDNCIMGDKLYYDNSTALIGANCSYTLYDSNNSISSNGVCNSSNEYYFHNISLSNVGTYIFNLNCSYGNQSESVNLYYDLVNIGDTIYNSGGNGGSAYYYYNTNGIDSQPVDLSDFSAELLISGAGITPGFTWGADLFLERMKLLVVGDKFGYGLRSLEERQHEFYKCLGLNNSKCSALVIEQSEYDFEVLKKYHPVGLIEDLDKYLVTFTNYRDISRAVKKDVSSSEAYDYSIDVNVKFNEKLVDYIKSLYPEEP